MIKASGLAACALAVLVLFSSCGTPYMTPTPTGVLFTRYNYVIRFHSPPAFGFVSGDWIVDNMHQGRRNDWLATHKEHRGDDWRMNDGRDYYGDFEIDRDGDGTPEKEKVFFYDLKLTHRRGHAVMWVQSVELGYKDRDRELHVLMERYVESLSGTGLFRSGNMFLISTLRTKTYSARILEKTSQSFLGREALSAKISLVHQQRRRTDPSYQGQVLQVTLVKIPFKYYSSKYRLQLEGSAVLLVGYYNTFSDFESSVNQFYLLKNAIQIHDLQSKTR